MSYEKYLKTALEMISNHLSVRSYKLAPKDEYPFFERGKDIRVVIYWKNSPAVDISGRKYEFIVEVPFWLASNTNKDDRLWMRTHADVHVKAFKDAVADGLEKSKKSKKKTKKKTKKKISAGTTQVLFEEMKKQK